MSLIIIPMILREANLMVERLHRHHKPVVGHRFSLGAITKSGEVVGVCICGRPIARQSDQQFSLEVLRVATTGKKNACSFLLGAAGKVAKELGFEEIHTFTLESESGSSLRAVGWESIIGTHGKYWGNRAGRDVDCTNNRKIKWFKVLNKHPMVDFERTDT